MLVFTIFFSSIISLLGFSSLIKKSDQSQFVSSVPITNTRRQKAVSTSFGILGAVGTLLSTFFLIRSKKQSKKTFWSRVLPVNKQKFSLFNLNRKTTGEKIVDNIGYTARLVSDRNKTSKRKLEELRRRFGK